MRIYPLVIRELVQSFKEQIEQNGEEVFSAYIQNLHFHVPKKFRNEQIACELYEKCSEWFDKEILKLEKELQVPFSVQTEDLKHISLMGKIQI